MIAEGWLSWAEEDVDAAMEQLPYLKYYKTEERPFDTRSYRTGSYNIKHEHILEDTLYETLEYDNQVLIKIPVNYALSPLK